SKVSGNVKDARGNSSSSAVVLAFPTDPARWSGTGPRPRIIKSVAASSSGTYAFNHLPAGDYFVIAINAADSDDWNNPRTLESLSHQSARLTVVAGIANVVDLTVKAVR